MGKKFNGNISDFPDAITKDKANTMIAAYANDRNKLSTYSFLYDASELASYINNCDNINTLNIFIGEYTDANNNAKLSLIFCGVDNNGNLKHPLIQMHRLQATTHKTLP